MGKRKHGRDAKRLNEALARALLDRSPEATRKALALGADPDAEVAFFVDESWVAHGDYADEKIKISAPGLAWCLVWHERQHERAPNAGDRELLLECALELARAGADGLLRFTDKKNDFGPARKKAILTAAAERASLSLGMALLEKSATKSGRKSLASAKAAQTALNEALSAAIRAGTEQAAWIPWLVDLGANPAHGGAECALCEAARMANPELLRELLAPWAEREADEGSVRVELASSKADIEALSRAVDAENEARLGNDAALWPMALGLAWISAEKEMLNLGTPERAYSFNSMLACTGHPNFITPVYPFNTHTIQLEGNGNKTKKKKPARQHEPIEPLEPFGASPKGTAFDWLSRAGLAPLGTRPADSAIIHEALAKTAPISFQRARSPAQRKIREAQIWECWKQLSRLVSMNFPVKTFASWTQHAAGLLAHKQFQGVGGLHAGKGGASQTLAEHAAERLGRDTVGRLRAEMEAEDIAQAAEGLGQRRWAGAARGNLRI